MEGEIKEDGRGKPDQPPLLPPFSLFAAFGSFFSPQRAGLMIFKSLVTKIILSTSLLLFVALGISWFIHMNIYEAQLMDQVRTQVDTVLDTAETSISKSMRIGKTDDTENILTLVNSHMKDRSAVRIFHPDGVIIKSTNEREMGKRVDEKLFESFRKGEMELISPDGRGGRILNKTRPIKKTRECFMCHGPGEESIGIINAEISLASTDYKLNEARVLSNLSAVLISIILSLFIFLWLYWIVIKPIAKLNSKMVMAEGGDLSVRSELTQGDEVGNLGRSFDAMIERLQHTRSELERYHFQQLERADRLASVGELASGIAHEIKNPLAGIAGAVQVLAREFKDDEQKVNIMGEILQQIGRLDKSVKDLLNYASPSMPTFEKGHINYIIDKALFFVTQQPKARDVRVVKELDPDLPPMKRVDEKQIQQVLLNLFLNALNAMDGAGTLRIATFMEDEATVVIEVEDTGKGIPEEELSKLFVPFYTTRVEGTGLGLSISNRIVEQHGGKISVTSSVNKGTCMKVSLPLDGPQDKGQG